MRSNSFWSLVGREGGDKRVTRWMTQLKGDAGKMMRSEYIYCIYIIYIQCKDVLVTFMPLLERTSMTAAKRKGLFRRIPS